MKYKINSNNSEFLFFGGQDYWYHNRAHADIQFAKELSNYGPVLYVNSLVMQKISFSRKSSLLKKIVRKSKSIFTGLKKVDDNFWVYSPVSLPVHHGFLKSLNTTLIRIQVTIASKICKIKNPLIVNVIPVAYQISKKMKKKSMIYFKTDKYDLFPNIDVESIKYFDTKLKEESDLTVLVSRKLFDDEKDMCRKALYVDHGVDFELFSSFNHEIPEDIKKIPSPRIGYFGTIDSHTVDIAFLSEVAQNLPENSFVFVGPKAKDYSELFSLPNVYYLGKKEHDEIPAYGHAFDVSIMAWNNTKWIEACNPIKLKEYLAIGKPVVSTYFPELENYKNVVIIAETPELFSESISQQLESDNGQYRLLRQNHVVSDTWQNKTKIILKEIK